MRLLFPGWRCKAVAAIAGFVNEGERDVLANTRYAAVSPDRELIGRAIGVELDLIRRAVEDVHVAAVAHPSRMGVGKVRVGILDAPVEFFFKVIHPAAGIGIPPLPELPDEHAARFIGGEAFKDGAFVRGDEVADRAVDPFVGGLGFNRNRQMPLGQTLPGLQHHVHAYGNDGKENHARKQGRPRAFQAFQA